MQSLMIIKKGKRLKKTKWLHTFCCPSLSSDRKFVFLVVSPWTLYIHIYICIQNHNDAMKTSDTVFLEKYTSHFIWKGSKGLLKVLLSERWDGGWTELQHIDPHSYGHNSVSFPFSWADQPGAWGPILSGCWFSLPHLISNWLTSCLHPGYIIVRRQPSSWGRHKSHSFNP